MSAPANALVVVIAGVSGTGKTTIGTALAQRLQWPFQEGDLFHDPANIERMRRGEALDDTARMPWLQRIAAWIDGQLAAGQNSVVTCSALKRKYRDMLVRDSKQVLVVMLRANESVIAERLTQRTDHFMPASLLASQFDAFEAPAVEESTVVIDASQSIESSLAQIEIAINRKHQSAQQ